ncbi:LytR/AlgR family response regulator transcription factor [Pseudoalteromonas luteoviolacea]|uniref:Uncharacterized protein n=1 Tax=Pseudoalteromonas luteoviolacea S4054 TaxID=1129367 RepID=A0A0F6A463_9GAMM|nr:LytTR family DNA-binding domain-containing protein [Pseudoalteromonas luteoviolacea]AOT11079.1 DNA-binding response regulator [Pseudoalteromonas luteoviolacea]AOT15757.1 DNA-binding response regulator [Pseudoalteromonas luteoviolacea]AOT20900.1 DNA-binding response regulator [Pseudoalteromonas luteoviolacea]KKE80985.1 hypothetical protein N479_24055 [Pseudoalteromonas luteoviolacea S4054]KZN74554.1 hypothetical protein N481_09020 [Pseudoalteromonas luteoviolacea S4047-1]
MLKVAIIEDEQPALDKLTSQLEELKLSTLVYTNSRPIASLTELQDLKLDVVFVDINLPQINGVDFAKRFIQSGYTGQLIFTTAYSEFAVDAFDMGATDYLLKPYDTERLALALNRVNHQLVGQQKTTQTLTCKFAGKVCMVEVNHIETIKLEHGQAIAHTPSRSYPLDFALDDLTHILPNQFLRVHRDSIVNTHRIDTLERWVTGGYLITLQNSRIQVISSRNGAKLLKNILNL